MSFRIRRPKQHVAVTAPKQETPPEKDDKAPAPKKGTGAAGLRMKNDATRYVDYL